jgi:hypothetical protein
MTISPGKGVGGVVAGRQPEVGDPPPARLSRHLLGSIFVFLLGPGAVTYLKINNQHTQKTKNTAAGEIPVVFWRHKRTLTSQ